MMMLRPAVHILLHGLVPGLVARLGFARDWKRAWLIMLAANAVDLDHLLAHVVYDPNRCSIGFHPLHAPWLFLAYGVLFAIPRSRALGLGLLLHMALDGIDCFWMMYGS